MSKKIYKVTVFLIGLFCTFLIVFFPTSLGGAFDIVLENDVHALEKASVKSIFASSYVVNEKNVADSTISIDLKNIGSNPTILTSYDLNLGSVTPSNLSVKHGNSNLKYEIFETKGLIVRIFIGDVLLRPDSTYSVSVSYEVKNFFTDVGGTNDAILPIFKLGSSSSVDTIVLEFPKSFGELNYINVSYSEEIKGSNYIINVGDPEDLSSIFVSVGDKKSFTFNFERELKNSADTYVKKDFILLPDLNSQTVLFNSISPYPDYVSKSQSGNYVLGYNVAPSDSLWMRIGGIIINENSSDEKYYLSTPERNLMLETDGEYWKIDDKDILKEIDGISDDAKLEEKVEWIYDYIMEKLDLDEKFRDLHGSENRKGANIALKTYKFASVEDFADSFVALARQLKIPSRVVAGYVFPYSVSNKNAGMFHVWPQYWSGDKGWVSVDPAYEEYTEFPQLEQVGLGRVIIAVVTDEYDSERFDDMNDEIFLTSENVEPGARLEVVADISDSISAGTTNSGTLIVKNKGNVVLNNLSFQSVGKDFDINFDESFNRNVILPGEEIEINFDVGVSKWYVSGDNDLEIIVVTESSDSTERVSISEVINIEPLWWAEPVSWALTVLLFVLITALAYGLARLVIFLINKIRSKDNKLTSIRE